MSPGDIVAPMPVMWACWFQLTFYFFHQLVGGVDRMQQVLAIGKRPHIVVSVVDSMIFSTFFQAKDLKFVCPIFIAKNIFLLSMFPTCITLKLIH